MVLSILWYRPRSPPNAGRVATGIGPHRHPRIPTPKYNRRSPWSSALCCHLTVTKGPACCQRARPASANGVTTSCGIRRPHQCDSRFVSQPERFLASSRPRQDHQPHAQRRGPWPRCDPHCDRSMRKTFAMTTIVASNPCAAAQVNEAQDVSSSRNSNAKTYRVRGQRTPVVVSPKTLLRARRDRRPA